MILIPCAGAGKRWQDFLGGPKHLAVVEGARLIDRLVSRLHEYAPGQAIGIIAPDQRYHVPGAALLAPPPPEFGCGIDKIHCCWPYWSANYRTWIIWGDLWLSRAGARRIFEPGKSGIQWFGRCGPSARNHKAWGEIWALSFEPPDVPDLLSACCHAAYLDAAGYLDQGRARTVYQLLHGQDVREFARPSPEWTEIDDETEDFDSPRDLAGWQWGRLQSAATDKPTEPPPLRPGQAAP